MWFNSPFGSGLCCENREKISRISACVYFARGSFIRFAGRFTELVDWGERDFFTEAFFGAFSCMGLIYTDPMNGHNISMPSQDLIFHARLTPYRSLGPDGFKVLMGAIGLICLGVGLYFMMLGLWPIIGFMGLDFALIYWAFKANYKSARTYEDVEVSREHVRVKHVTPKGKEIDHRFPQFGTRFEVDRHEEIGITKMRIANRKKTVEFGYFLNPADRESFAEAFSRALSRAKR